MNVPTHIGGMVVGNSGEVLRNCDPTLSLKIRKNVKRQRAVAFLGVMYILCGGKPGFTHLYYDPESLCNQIAACTTRFGRVMPRADIDVMQDFFSFAKMFIMKYFRPLCYDDVKNCEEWLLEANYGGKRKEYLQSVRDRCTHTSDKTVVSLSFIKFEGYDKPKAPRAINSPSDESKVLLGPLQSCVDKKTFQNPFFVKGTDPRDWPRRMQEVLGNNPVMETDFSSFEAHHRGLRSKIVLFWMMHMVRGVTSNCYRRLIARMILGSNRTKFSRLDATIVETLMSGAMWTSSSNGVLNCIIMAYLTSRTLQPDVPVESLISNVVHNFRGLVEGDDGICVAHDVDEQLIAKLGLDLKFKMAPHFCEAKFCGIMADQETMEIVRDPLKTLRNFFVLSRKYVSFGKKKQYGLLRAKALSLKYNYNNCPIVGPLCDQICYLTRSFDPRPYERIYTYKAMCESLHTITSCVKPSARYVVERRFGVTIDEQVRIEQAILRSKGIFDLGLENYLTHEQWRFQDMFINVDVVPQSDDKCTDPIILQCFSGRKGAVRKSAVDADKKYEKGSHFVSFID